MEHGHHELGRHPRGDGREARPGHRALLVERPIPRGVVGGHDVAAEVAPQPLGLLPRSAAAAVVVAMFLEQRRRRTVPHDEPPVESERRVDQRSVRGEARHGREPPALPRVRQEENHVVPVDERVEPLDVGGHALRLRVAVRVARHGDHQHDALGADVRAGDRRQRLGRRGGLVLAAVPAVVDGEEALPDGVAVRDPAAVDEGHVPHPPAEQRPGHVAPQRARAEEEDLEPREHLDVERRQGPPLHQAQVQVVRLPSEVGGGDEGAEVDGPGPRLVVLVELPPHALVFVRRCRRSLISRRGPLVVDLVRDCNVQKQRLADPAVVLAQVLEPVRLLPSPLLVVKLDSSQRRRRPVAQKPLVGPAQSKAEGQVRHEIAQGPPHGLQLGRFLPRRG